MHPDAHERSETSKMLGLGNLAGVMRECKVGTAAMNIELRPQVLHGHGAAFDMPAGATGPPGTGPRRFARRLGLPEHEIKRIFLARVIRIIATLVSDLEHGIIGIQADGMRHS